MFPSRDYGFDVVDNVNDTRARKAQEGKELVNICVSPKEETNRDDKWEDIRNKRNL